MNQKKIRKNMNCPICLERIYMGPSITIHKTTYNKLTQRQVTERLHRGKVGHTKYKKTFLLPCGHLYHKICISKWLRQNPSCPLCRE